MGVEITEDDIARFTEGDCHILARQINRLTGWPMYVFNPMPNDEFYGKYGDIHAFVRHPSGKILDVEGLHTPGEFKRKWKCPRMKRITWEKMDEAWPTAYDGYGMNGWSYLRAAQIARELVNRFQA